MTPWPMSSSVPPFSSETSVSQIRLLYARWGCNGKRAPILFPVVVGGEDVDQRACGGVVEDGGAEVVSAPEVVPGIRLRGQELDRRT